MSIFYTVVITVLAVLLIAGAASLMAYCIERCSQCDLLHICPVCGSELRVYRLRIEHRPQQLYVECPQCHRQSYIKDNLMEALESLQKDPLQ